MAFFEPVRSYREMAKVVEAFGDPKSRLSFVVIRGNPGIGKTNTFREKVVHHDDVLECNASPFGLYTWLYERRDAEVIALDDVENILEKPEGQALIRALCQTDKVKPVSWNTAAADQREIPRTFNMKARVILFCNKLGRKGKNLGAVLDRGHLYHFMPTAQEVHSEVLRWQAEKELAQSVDAAVVDFIGTRLDQILKPTFRDYVKASEKKRSGLDWKSWLEAKWTQDPKLTACSEILRLANAGDSTLQTAEQRAEKFAEWGHGTRSTFFEYQKKAMRRLGWKRMPKAKAAKAPGAKAKATKPKHTATGVL